MKEILRKQHDIEKFFYFQFLFHSKIKIIKKRTEHSREHEVSLFFLIKKIKIFEATCCIV